MTFSVKINGLNMCSNGPVIFLVLLLSSIRHIMASSYLDAYDCAPSILSYCKSEDDVYPDDITCSCEDCSKVCSRYFQLAPCTMQQARGFCTNWQFITTKTKPKETETPRAHDGLMGPRAHDGGKLKKEDPIRGQPVSVSDTSSKDQGVIPSTNRIFCFLLEFGDLILLKGIRN